MKKTYLSVGMVLIVLISQAQIKKGAILLGGGIDITSGKGTGANSNYTTASTGINPSVGRAIQDNLVVGLNLFYTYATDNSGLQETTQTNREGAGIFIRKYRAMGRGLAFYAQTNLNFVYSDQQYDWAPATSTPRQELRSTSAVLAFSPGIAYTLTPRWQLELSVPSLIYFNYSHSKNAVGPNDGNKMYSSINDFTFSSSFSGNTTFSIGFHYVIGG